MTPVAMSQPAEVAAALGIGLLAVLLGGFVVGRVLSRVVPVATEEGERPEPGGIPRAGLYIGWLERALIYTCLVVGMPAAVAVVVAIKTAARFPRFEREDDFVEYYLIGTLTSLAIALAAALIARAILGLRLASG